MNNKLTIEAFILCYNEEKMLPHTINHYSGICDKITIIDNESTDNSINELKEAAKTTDTEICIKQFDTKGKLRDDAYLLIKNTCWKKSTADFVIVCDMDELLYHPNLISELKIAKENGFGIINTEGYNMFSETFPNDYTKSIIQQIKRGARAFNFDKNIIFSPKLIENINYQPGAHTCNPIYYNNAPDIRPKTKFKLLHYKYIGYDYLVEKHRSYAQRLSDYNKTHNFGGQYLKGEKHVKECFSQLKKLNLPIVI